MSLKAEGINGVRQCKDVTARSNACFKCGMIGHFFRDCTVSTMDSADNGISPAVGEIQTTVTADSPVTNGILN